MINAGKFRAVAAIAVALALAGCQNIGGPSRPGGGFSHNTPPPSSGFNGDWMSTDGVAISRFTNGYFETLATDTGNKLAEGSYTQIDATSVSISVTSLIRQSTTQVNCAMISQTQLNCTSSAGSQFSLIRRAGRVS